MNHLRLVALLALVFGGALLRLADIRVPLIGVDGGANFAPIRAIAIFCGLTFRSRWLAFGLPLLATLTADIALGLKNNGDFGSYVFSWTMLFVYAGWVLYVLCGRGVRLAWTLKTERPGRLVRTLSLVGGSLAGSSLFFLVSNFGVWVAGNWYAKTASGFIECYVAAVPFFRATAQSDVLYLFGLVAAHAIVKVMTAGTERESAVLYAD